MHDIAQMLRMAAGASVPVTRQAGGTAAANISASTTFTTAALAVGDAQPSRFVVATIAAIRSNGLSPQDCLVTAVNIGGVAATKLVGLGAQQPGAEPYIDRCMWGASIPAGATATVAVTVNRTITAYCVSLEAVYDALVTPAYTTSNTYGPDVPIMGVERGLVLSGNIGGGEVLGPSMTYITEFGTGAPEYVNVLSAFYRPVASALVNTIDSYTGYIHTVSVSFAPR